ncbi:DUF421 domain-containing protein [Hymenobacter endophyticus]|uniref:DUF421 domain-containing protein n=1 Tax=Hymenobacter endophyticus TaxID=3076335 RepID=A0ABU3TKE2_9BACT|nr:YetF domain-containing protein [Hymenobacter endophyticus]MDU0371802.1 DUF421 domain-containing protein [Hymenobacter endophyticus]
MLLATPITPFDWNRILLSEDAPPLYLLEVLVRCIITYIMTLAVLRVTGRRGVKQLSLFELSIVLALGSAAGDAMFYDDVPLAHVGVVFGAVALMYWGFNRLTEQLPRFSDWLEGAPVLLVEEGIINMKNFRKQRLNQKELFGELRRQQIEHLGQVRRVYIEATGEMSIYFFEDADVRSGLPVWPERVDAAASRVAESGEYACCQCGQVQELPRGGAASCSNCRYPKWVPACTDKRVQ